MNKYILFSILIGFTMLGCSKNMTSQLMNSKEEKDIAQEITHPSKNMMQEAMVSDKKKDKEIQGEPLKTQTAIFAGGCFWCIEASFQEAEGVLSAISGFTGGREKNPSYKEVATGETTHREAVEVTYDPEIVSYEELLKIFWTSIDPTDEGGQFADRGHQYTTAIYYTNPEQAEKAQKSKQFIEDSKKFEEPIATEILEKSQFYSAGEAHQDFYKKSSDYYKRYKVGSGRQGFIDDNWAKSFFIELEEREEKEKEEKLKKRSSYDLSPEEIAERIKNLDPLSYHVIAEGGTESPFNNAYWNNKAEGIYVDKLTRDPLFSSTHKYDSGTGWPSFYTTLQEESVSLHEDNKLAVPRTEIRGSKGDTHLGHVFDDGPADKGGKRFCTNSASLEFISREEMASQGYGKWLFLFEEK